MDEAILAMLKKYRCHTQQDYKNALKEIIQEVALLGLWRAKFFEKGAFYGGTALRILYGLDRFSEDLDFSLLHPDPHFNLDPYEKALKIELQSLGFDIEIEHNVKIQESAIQSAFLKANTLKHLISIGLPEKQKKACHMHEQLKIKLEVDTNPPLNFQTEVIYLLNPIPFSVNTYTKPNLFAGKIHALLCRTWKNRVKGRDWYDFIWYLGRNIPVNLSHLQARMVQTGHYPSEKKLTHLELIHFLEQKVQELNISMARQDIIPFLKDPKEVDIWSKEFFLSVLPKLQSIE